VPRKPKPKAPKPRKPSRFLPARLTVPSTPESDASADQGIRRVIVETRDAAKGWLDGQGWRLAAAVSEGWTACFIRTRGGKVEILKGQDNGIDPRDAVSHQVFTYAESARLAMERGDFEKAAGWAWYAGFFSGKSNDMLNESEAASCKRKGDVVVPDAAYRKAIEAAGGARAKPADIMVALSPADYKALSRDSHYKSIARIKRELEIH
jgi:hypothetical protein